MPTSVRYLYVAFLAVPFAMFLWSMLVIAFRRRPVRIFIKSPAVAPDAYATAMIEDASARGFRWVTAGVHPRYASLHASLLRSSDGFTLAIVAFGRIKKRSIGHAALLSRSKRDRTLITSEWTDAAELDPNTKRQTLLNADFDELWRLHTAALAERTDEWIAFADASTWADVDASDRSRTERAIEAGRVRYADAEREHVRLTWRGAFHATIVQAFRRRFTPRPAARRYKPRPGSARHRSQRSNAAPPAVVADLAESADAADGSQQPTL